MFLKTMSVLIEVINDPTIILSDSAVFGIRLKFVSRFFVISCC